MKKRLFTQIDSVIQILGYIDSITKQSQYVEGLDLSNYINQSYAIRAKLADTTFKIGIIGEFSSGKTTFINAFLEKRYLVEDSLQGTTCSSTVVCYGEQENVLITYTNGSTKKMIDTGIKGIVNKSLHFVSSKLFSKPQQSNEERIKDFLRTCTAVEEEAKNIAQVTWISPIPVLKDGFVIVDTPGIGSLNPRHTAVARSAAKECDALLVLTNLAGGMLSADLISAVREIAGPQAENCIFVGTHLDLMKNPKEIIRINKFFSQKLTNSFGAERPYYLVSPYKALEQLAGKITPSPQQNYLAHFRSFRQEIYEDLDQRRQYIQCGKISDLLKDFVRTLNAKLTETQNSLQSLSTQFQQKVIANNSSFWDRWHQRLPQTFQRESKSIIFEYRDGIHNLINMMYNEIVEDINNCDSKDRLERYLKHGINRVIDHYNNEFKRVFVTGLEEAMIDCAQRSCMEFNEELNRNYTELQNVGQKLVSLQPAALQNTSTSFTVSGQHQFNELVKNFEENAEAGTGMIAAGAAAAFMLPGIGIFLGGILAALGALVLFFSSLDDRKEEAINKIGEFANESYTAMSQKLAEFGSALTDSLQQSLSATIEQQRQAYNQMVEEYNKNIYTITRNMNTLHNTIQEQRVKLSHIQQTLDATHAQISA